MRNDTNPGPLAAEKQSNEIPEPEPKPSEVESARLLANDARGALRAAGLSDDEIDRLADQFIAEDRGEGVPEFVAWARGETGAGSSKA